MTDETAIVGSDGSTEFGLIVRSDSGWTLRLADPELSYIRIDFQTRLQFGETEVVIEGAFSVHVQGVDHHLDPEHRVELGPLLGLYPGTLSAASIDADKTLHLELAGDATIVVPPDPQYEAWQVNRPGSFLVVCPPGESTELAIGTG